MTRMTLGRLEIVLPQSLKHQFFAECERRGYMPSRVLRLMLTATVEQWQVEETTTQPNTARTMPLDKPSTGACSDVMTAPRS